MNALRYSATVPNPSRLKLKLWRRSLLKHKILLWVPPARSKCFWADDFYHFAKLRWGWDRGLTFILIIRFLKSHIWEKLEPRRARMLQAFVAWNADNVDGLLKNERTELRMTFWHIRVVERAIDLNIWKRIDSLQIMMNTAPWHSSSNWTWMAGVRKHHKLNKSVFKAQTSKTATLSKHF